MSKENKDLSLLDNENYEQYLDTFLTRHDVHYLDNIQNGRILVKFGYRSATGVYTLNQFLVRRQIALESLFPAKKSNTLFSSSLSSHNTDELLIELANRESPNTQKNVSTIIFITHRLSTGFDVSSYIDFAQSLLQCNSQQHTALDWSAIFAGKKFIEPRPSDLSYYHWRTGTIINNSSDNYYVINDPQFGLMFKYKGDRKLICVDPAQERFKDNSYRNRIQSEAYGQVVLYDHIVRKRL